MVLVVALSAAVSLSITASEITFLVALAMRLVRWGLGDRPERIPAVLWWSMLALVGTWLVSGFFSPEMGSSVLRVHRLYLMLVMFVVSENARSPGGARRLVWAYLTGAVIAATYNLVHWIAVLPTIGESHRLKGVFANAMTSGNIHAMGLVGAVAVLLGTTGRLRFAGAVTSLAAAVALGATYTRSSWVGAGAGIIALAGLGRRWRMLGIIAILGLVAVLMAPQLRNRMLSIVTPVGQDLFASDYSSRGRISLWLTGLELFAERPITGWGLADHSELIEEHRRADATFVAGHFHSNPVQVAVATGSLGLAAYTAFHLAILALLWRRRHSSVWARAAIGVWVTFHISGLFDWSFGDAEIAYQYFWWMGLGLAGAGEGEH
jgi:O-antigen ligase